LRAAQLGDPLRVGDAFEGELLGGWRPPRVSGRMPMACANDRLWSGLHRDALSLVYDTGVARR
jgi:hypothetical protein